MANEAIRLKTIFDNLLDRTLTNQEALDFGNDISWYLIFETGWAPEGGGAVDQTVFDNLTNDEKATIVLDELKVTGKVWLGHGAEMDIRDSLDTQLLAASTNASDTFI